MAFFPWTRRCYLTATTAIMKNLTYRMYWVKNLPIIKCFFDDHAIQIRRLGGIIYLTYPWCLSRYFAPTFEVERFTLTSKLKAEVRTMSFGLDTVLVDNMTMKTTAYIMFKESMHIRIAKPCFYRPIIWFHSTIAWISIEN